MTEDIKQFLLDSQAEIQDDLFSQIVYYKQLMREEPSIFHGDIEEQFLLIVRDHLMNLISKNLATDSETIGIVLDDFDIKTFILS